MKKIENLIESLCGVKTSIVRLNKTFFEVKVGSKSFLCEFLYDPLKDQWEVDQNGKPIAKIQTISFGWVLPNSVEADVIAVENCLLTHKGILETFVL